MVTIKNPVEIIKMRKAGQILAEAIEMLKKETQVGVNCLDLDKKFADFITEKGATSNFLNYHGYPNTICISINDQLVHGIPQNRVIQNGDIVSIDCGCIYDGYHADAAFTKICGFAKEPKHDILVKATEEALAKAIAIVRPGTRIGDIGAEIQTYIEQLGFALPREYTGHGIGQEMHEDPYIPNYGVAGTGMRLQPGMVIAIEPMVQIGTHKTKVGADHWTVSSADKSMAAHFEHTLVVTNDGAEVLTKLSIPKMNKEN
ncbi:methionyl aminopeptidase [Entomoplasma freundtii]|uniref:Methionine aminopeptidase n=1 Tax=Entomoplasma freundtii TaxID=74700 RepID=A0A2K8NRW8_9MOLU|nr:type I methionyl aminopeptidase [Entomoplasma freundtii]ATZ16580.1 methionine aminopeptidase [Entomoplasma freundtii]TDY58254.1 methionyl aminopeptidase [Entomoplasma freundtii]